MKKKNAENSLTIMIADGLDASVDGRGFNGQHMAATQLADGAPRLLLAARGVINNWEEQSTPNGYDRRLLDAFNGILEDRESEVRLVDITDDLWESRIAKIVDDIEEQVGFNVETRKVTEDESLTGLALSQAVKELGASVHEIQKGNPQLDEVLQLLNPKEPEPVNQTGLNVIFNGIQITVLNAVDAAEAYDRLGKALVAAGFEWSSDTYQEQRDGVIGEEEDTVDFFDFDNDELEETLKGMPNVE